MDNTIMRLKHLPEDETLTPPEIAAAIFVVEARKSGGTERDEETTLRDVLRQIAPNVSPEEVRTEVFSQRVSGARSRRRTRRLRSALAAVTAAVIVAGSIVSYSASVPEQTITTYSLTWPETQQRIMAQDTLQSRPILRTLAEVPDKHMVTVTADAIYSAISEEWPSTGPRPSIDNTPSEMSWHIDKIGNHLYVRGWTRERFSSAASRIGPVGVYNTPTAPGLGPEPVQISVRTTPGSVFSPFATPHPFEWPHDHSWERFNFSPVQTDEHTWEKW